MVKAWAEAAELVCSLVAPVKTHSNAHTGQMSIMSTMVSSLPRDSFQLNREVKRLLKHQTWPSWMTCKPS